MKRRIGDWLWWNTVMLGRRRERVTIWIAWHLPRSLAYWTFIRVAVDGTDSYPGERRILEAARGWSHVPQR